LVIGRKGAEIERLKLAVSKLTNGKEIYLDIKEIQAFQWVQGMGLDMPIMQWVPLIKKIQDAGKSVIIDLQLNELEDFISSVDKKGIYLCIAADEDLQPDIIKRVEKW